MAVAEAKERLEARVSAEEKRLLEEAASRQGQTLSAFVIASAHDAAVRTLEVFNMLAVVRQDQIAFVDAILSPPEPSTRLKRAAREYLRVTERR